MKVPNIAPRQALALAAQGELAVDQGTLESLLAGMALEMDQRARELGSHFDGLMGFLMSAPDGLSPEAVMKMASTVSALTLEHSASARRSLGLLSKIIRPGSPTVKITAANAQVNVAAVDLGGDQAK